MCTLCSNLHKTRVDSSQSRLHAPSTQAHTASGSQREKVGKKCNKESPHRAGSMLCPRERDEWVQTHPTNVQTPLEIRAKPH